MKHLKTIISGILAGVAISIGGMVSVYLKSIDANNLVISAFLFSFGLLTICSFSLCLYTGRIAYIVDNRKGSYVVELLEMFLGNFIGCVLMGLITRALRIYGSMAPTFDSMCKTKNQDNLLSLFFLAFMCGIHVYLAVEFFKSKHHPLIRVLGLVFSISIFVILGFEHVVADIYYYASSSSITPMSIVVILIIFLGNSLGSICLHLLRKLVMEKKED